MTRVPWGRRLFHLSGIVIPVVYMWSGRTFALALTIPLLIASCVIETMRIRGYMKSAFVNRYLKDKERVKPSGSFFYIIASLITILLFPAEAALPSLFVLSVCDPLSSYVGQAIGRVRFRGKSLEGSSAFFVSCLLILMAFRFPSAVVIITSFAATATELLSSRLVDDNLTIPLVTATVLTLLG